MLHEELTKPLGVDRPGKSWLRIFPVAAAMSVSLAAAIGFAWYFLYLDASTQSSESEPAQTMAAADTETASQSVDSETAQQTNSGEPAELNALEPRGRIAEKIPLAPVERPNPDRAHIPDPDLVERISSGYLPKRSSGNLRPMDAYSRAPDTEGNFGVARVVIIVGGLGISQTSTQRAIRNLPPAVTLAFAPYGNSLDRWTQEARKSGHEIMLQLPMEPIGYPEKNPGKHTLLRDAGPIENIANLHWLMSRFTNYVGIINYLGGGFLADPAAMKPVFDEIADRGLLFVDDGTVRNSQSDESAANSLLPYAASQIRLDVIRDRSKIAQSLENLAKEAKRTGLAIGYANAFPESIAMIAQFAGNAGAKGIEITPVTSAVRDPERQ